MTCERADYGQDFSPISAVQIGGDFLGDELLFESVARGVDPILRVPTWAKDDGRWLTEGIGLVDYELKVMDWDEYAPSTCEADVWFSWSEVCEMLAAG